MEMNLGSLMYLFFRLSPFILVCVFALGSIFNSEIKGFVYLVGLVFACFAAFLFNSMLGDNANDQTNPKSLLCNSFSINNIYPDKTPASVIILSYTFFYLVFPIAKHNLAIYNVPTLVIFPLLILADIWWNYAHNCFPIVNCIVTFVIAACVGVTWAWFIEKTNMPSLQYFNVGSNRERCSRPSKQMFRCKTIKTSSS